MNYDKSEMILRYYIDFENPDERFDQLVDFLKRTGIHKIVLFSSCFLEESSFIKEEYYKKHSKLLKPYVEKLKDDITTNTLDYIFTNIKVDVENNIKNIKRKYDELTSAS